MIYWTAFAMGVFSSLHCIGMCGPIALATPVINHSFYTQLLSRILYNSGRMVSYMIIGTIAGTVGYIFVLGGLQQWISIIAGLLILLWVILPRTNPENWKLIQNLRIVKLLRNMIGKLLKRKKYSTIFLIGVLNGFIPCGMVYMALVGAMATSNVYSGSLFMLFFALGTWPFMLILTSAWELINQNFKSKSKKIIPYMVGLVGILLIVRGVGLGIPYLSPSLKSSPTEITSCN